MRTSRGIAFLLALCAFVAMATTAFAEKAPVGSFAKDGVSTVSDLVSQLKDPQVAQRYEAVYNISASELSSKLKDFKLITLKSPIEAPVYYIDKSGKVASKSQILLQGTAVFADKDGNPAICWWTGNPIGSGAGVLPVSTAAGAAVGTAAGTAAGTAGAGIASAAAWVAPVVAVAATTAIIANNNNDSAVPEPAGIIALATGLIGLPFIRRFKISK